MNSLGNGFGAFASLLLSGAVKRRESKNSVVFASLFIPDF